MRGVIPPLPILLHCVETDTGDRDNITFIFFTSSLHCTHELYILSSFLHPVYLHPSIYLFITVAVLVTDLILL
jgi:hypothetical protein